MAVFLRDDGVLAMGNKTPVTILQEMIQKQGLTPHYELIFNGTGTMDPVFKFRVSGACLTAIGDGKSKKEAKHDAAAALLRRMNNPENNPIAEGIEEPIASPYFGALKQNFVGMLDEVCVINKVPFPFYKEVGEEGPPHARIFTMQCKVSTITEVAVARTKKQAKHMVAQQMIARISDILGDKFILQLERTDTEPATDTSDNSSAIEKEEFRQDLSIPLSELHNIFSQHTDDFLLPQMFLDLPNKPEEFYQLMDNPKEFLDELVKSLRGTSNTVSSTMRALQEALLEIEKDCAFSLTYDESSEEDEEINSSDDVDELCVGKYKLEEHDFDDSDKEETNNRLENSAHKIEEDLSEERNSYVEATPLVNKPKQSSDKKPKPLKLYSLFLSIECPQGLWTFHGTGDTMEEADHDSIMQAILFLRAMAIPSGVKKPTENAT